MIESPEDKDDIIDELIDRYGDVPRQTMNLLSVALVRAAAKRCEITSIIEEINEIKIHPHIFDFEVWSELSDIYRGRIRVVMSDSPVIMFKKHKDDDVLAMLYKLFCQYHGILQKYV